MLPAFKTVLIPPLEVRVDSPDMAALAAGLVEDLALLMSRLGDVRVITRVTDPRSIA